MLPVDYSKIDSPSILLIEENIDFNIKLMVKMAGSVDRLMPHVKTHKMAVIIQKMVKVGIVKFKVATIAEAELAAINGAEEVLIAHQLTGFKLQRLKTLIQQYPDTFFFGLVDNYESIKEYLAAGVLDVFFDINNGMNRTGHPINDDLFDTITEADTKLKLHGLHIYDGHIHDASMHNRTTLAEEGLSKIKSFLQNYSKTVIVGGSPSFAIHQLNPTYTLSPGTGVFWDYGYSSKYEEQSYKHAAFVISRVISKPAPGIITTDMGYKSISSENPLNARAVFPNNPDLNLKSMSEEHGVFETKEAEKYQIGDIIEVIPYHICPSINLYDEAYVLLNNNQLTTWPIEARKRKITI